MKTKAQELGITEFPYIEYDDDGNRTYFEIECGFWVKSTYNDSGLMNYLELPHGYWARFEYDEAGNCTYRQHSLGSWEKREYDSSGNCIHEEIFSPKYLSEDAFDEYFDA
jgi:hypothetical protein